MQRLDDAPPELAPATLNTVATKSEPAVLERLHPGSWINSVFATWIGHPEKTRAWEVLTEIRDAIEKAGGGREPSLLLAEGSDWFWWLGDDNPTELAPLYDEIFRTHLADACDQAGIEPPVDLAHPLKTHTSGPLEESSVSALRHCPIKHCWTIIAPDREGLPGSSHRETRPRHRRKSIGFHPRRAAIDGRCGCLPTRPRFSGSRARWFGKRWASTRL